MSQLSDFFAAMERVLFELVTWVILIPKTLYRVLSQPSKVPEYVKGELNPKDEKRARFEGSVSPVFLFLLAAIGPFLLIRVVDIQRVPITGDKIAYVDSAYAFIADFEDVPEAYYSMSEWTIEPVGPEGGEWLQRFHCYEGRTSLVDCDQTEGTIVWNQFMTLVVEEEKSVLDAHTELARRFGEDRATEVAEYWCGSEPGELDLAGCSGPAGEGFELEPASEDVLDQFLEVISAGQSATEAMQLISEAHGEDVAAEIAEYWCAPPPGDGCEAKPAWDQFESVVYGGRSAEEAQRVVAYGYGREVARQIFDWWCSPPPDQGCPGAEDADDSNLESGAWNLAFDRFVELIDAGYDANQARSQVAAELGIQPAQEVLDLWCEPPAGPGCDAVLAAEPAMAQTEGAVASSDRLASDLPDEFVGDTIQLRWSQPGRYRISLRLYDMESWSLIDLSDDHEIEVRSELSRPKVAAARGSKDLTVAAGTQNQTAQQRGGASASRGEKVKQWFKSPATAVLALVFMAFPLILALATELRRGRPLTQATIKPAFYIQCLYLSPFVVSIWIPILLLRYSPRAEAEFGVAIILAIVLFFWLVIAEVGFVSKERSASRAKAILWLAIPVVFILSSLFVTLVVAGLHRYTVVETVGAFVMTLMLVPFLASIAGWLWRLVFSSSEATP